MKKYNYTLKVKAGEYYGDTLFLLLHEILKHRFHHLITDGKWID